MKPLLWIITLCLAFTTAHARDTSLSNQQIAERLIQQSIDNYSGNCPCPYNAASNGSRCGKRSAYSRPGGASPLCYVEDVSDEMIQRYRRASSTEARR